MNKKEYQQRYRKYLKRTKQILELRNAIIPSKRKIIKDFTH